MGELARRLVVGACAATALALPAPAGAAQWSQGEGPGRAGVQALGGRPPLEPMYRLDLPRGKRLATPLLISNAGRGPLAPRLAFGTEDGAVHLFDLYTGARVGAPEGVHVTQSFAPHTFSGFGGTIGLVDSSAPDGTLGQLWVVHDDTDQANPFDTSANPEYDDDVALAQIDLETGRLVLDAPIPGTADHRVSAAPLLSEPDATGERQLVVGMVDDEQWAQEYAEPDPSASDPLGLGGEPEDPRVAAQVVRIPIARAGAIDATTGFADAEAVAVDFLNALAPLSLGYFAALPEPGAKAPDPVPHVLLPTAAAPGPLQSRAVAELGTEGPSSPQLDRDATDKDLAFAQSAAVPVTPAGRAPGSAGSQAARAQALYVATHRAAIDRTIVHRLALNAAGDALVEIARSASYSGRPATQLATNALTGRPGTSAGMVVLATERGLVGLRGGDLRQVWRHDGGNFAHTAPAIVGDAVLAVRDDGAPIALDLRSGKRLGPEAFRPDAGQAGSRAAAPGSPAVANGVVVFASDRGVFAYRNTCGNQRRGTNQNEAILGTPAGDDVTALDGIDTVTTGDGGDCALLGGGDDVADLGDGADRAEGGPGDDRLLAGAGDDVLAGDGGADSVVAGDGDDRVTGGTEGDLIKGGNGRDRLAGDAGNDTLSGDGDDDLLVGGLGRDVLKGRLGDDELRGGRGADLLDGGVGNDVLAPGRGHDRVVGGAGDDRIAARDGRSDRISCGPGVDSVTADRADRLSGCERVAYRQGRKRKGRR